MPVHISTVIKRNQPNTTSIFKPGMLTPILVFFLLLIGVFSPFGCSAPKGSDGPRSAAQPSPVPPPQSQDKAATPGLNGLNACTLLSTAEIEAIQGEPVKEVKEVQGSQGKGGSLLISQCFFALPTFANSISVALTAPGSSRLGARELWQEQFHSTAASEKELDGSEGSGTSSRGKEKRKLLQPVAVSGLGEEAYWVRNRCGGALYVLKGDAFFRISIGGKQDDSLRLKKAQILAKDALGRMP
jgi:hypothetical protein